MAVVRLEHLTKVFPATPRRLTEPVGHLAPAQDGVANVRAAGGDVVLRNRRREPVRLVEVDPGERAPILRRFVQIAPGARPHVPVDRHAPVADFEPIAADYPVFRVTPRP